MNTRRRARKDPLLPKKYYAGLTRKNANKRKHEIEKYGSMSHKNPLAYPKAFLTNIGVHTKSSTYTNQWNKRFPNAKSLKERGEVTGVPEEFLKESFNRGMAAWRTGHRPGATQQQWGYARVSSFLLGGKTAHTTDSDIVKRAIESSKSAKKWFSQFNL